MRLLCTGREMADLDAFTINQLGVPGRVLMELAGRGVARAIRERFAASTSVVVLAGPGNNGGDGFVCARALAAWGYSVDVAVFAARDRLIGDAKAAFETLEREGTTTLRFIQEAGQLREFSTRMEQAGLLVDALLGTGARLDVRGVIAEAIDRANHGRAPIVAVDIPSGIDADTGRILGRAIHASATATFALLKRGHFLHPGRRNRGELVTVDIGIGQHLSPARQIQARVIDKRDLPALLPSRKPDAHKGDFGHVVVVAGQVSSPGAAVLACHAALRAGGGKVSWCVDDRVWRSAHGLWPEVMWQPRGRECVRRVLEVSDALVIGPGLGCGEGSRELIRALLDASDVPCCLDADAITVLAETPEIWSVIECPIVITPHPKEMARLSGMTVREIQDDRIGCAAGVAADRGCVVVLKGAGTVVAEPSGRSVVIDAGNPGLASAGTGDVLAGVVGSMLAQGLDPVRAATAAALLHGCAGDRARLECGEAGLVASDLLGAMGTCFSELNGVGSAIDGRCGAAAETLL